MYKIIVNSKKDSACNIAQHFRENWLGDNYDNLHPSAKVTYKINDNAIEDEIVVLDNEGNKEFTLVDSMALRLDSLQDFLIKINRL